MMEIQIFKDLTTSEYLDSLDAESEKYQGLYVDMDNAKERKFVKEQAEGINKLQKKLDRARIDLSRDYKLKVEAEFKGIKERLDKANSPFILLIDAHKEKRAKELAEAKAKEQAIADALQKERDHEDAIMMDKVIAFEKQEAIRLQKERDEEIARQARESEEKARIEAEDRADEAEKARLLSEAQAKRDAEAARIEAEKREKEAAEQAKRDAEIKHEQEAEAERQRLAKLEDNKKHSAKIRNEIKDCLMVHDSIDEALAVDIVTMIAKKQVANLTINY
jgi:hypothetical protein